METTRQKLSIAFRPMTLNDVSRVHEIDRLSFSLPWSERSFRFELTENDNSVAWVAETVLPDGQITVVGMVVAWVILDEAHIATIAVHPDFRGLGIGQKLLAKILLTTYQRGGRLAYLEVRRSNALALKMYLKFGFEIVGERPRYYQDNNEDALLMTLNQIIPDKMLKFAS